jgi:hypothetical protein
MQGSHSSNEENSSLLRHYAMLTVNSYDFQRSMPPPSTGSCNPLANSTKCETPWTEPACSSEISVTIYQSTWHNISEGLKLKKD